MKSFEGSINSDPADLIEMSKQGYFTIVPDENRRDDSLMQAKARGRANLTRNSEDFIDDAVRCDYDVIGIEDVKFVDSRPDRTDETVRNISGAVRRSKLATLKGNFRLKVRDNGSFHLKQLV